MNQEINQPMMNDEISLQEIWAIISEQWKVLMSGLIMGAVVGVALLLWMGYSAEATLNLRKGALDFLQSANLANKDKPLQNSDVSSWDYLISRLPAMANEEYQRLIQTTPSAENSPATIRQWRETDFWRKNVTPFFTVNKTDIKNLVGKVEDIPDSNRISRITFRAGGTSREDAQNKARELVDFFANESLTIGLRDLLIRYQTIVRQEPIGINAQIAGIEKELVYLRERLQNRQTLKNNYPNQVGTISQQVLDPKESGAKFLPLPTQLVALTIDLNDSAQQLERSRGRLREIEVLAAYLAKVEPLAKKELRGEALIEAQTKILAEIQNSINPKDFHQSFALSEIKRDIANIRVNQNNMFEGGALIETARNKNGKVAFFAAPFGALLLAMMFVFFRRAVAKPK